MYCKSSLFLGFVLWDTINSEIENDGGFLKRTFSMRKGCQASGRQMSTIISCYAQTSSEPE